MATVNFSVKYRYRKVGTSPWTSTTLGGIVKQESEQLVMQKLRDKHAGCEIELTEIKFK